jgi:hypothetical protein
MGRVAACSWRDTNVEVGVGSCCPPESKYILRWRRNRYTQSCLRLPARIFRLTASEMDSYPGRATPQCGHEGAILDTADPHDLQPTSCSDRGVMSSDSSSSSGSQRTGWESVEGVVPPAVVKNGEMASHCGRRSRRRRVTWPVTPNTWAISSGCRAFSLDFKSNKQHLRDDLGEESSRR